MEVNLDDFQAREGFRLVTICCRRIAITNHRPIAMLPGGDGPSGSILRPTREQKASEKSPDKNLDLFLSSLFARFRYPE